MIHNRPSTSTLLNGEGNSQAYSDALSFLYGRINYERLQHASAAAPKYRLDRLRSLLAILGNPQDRYPILHVAGTKGKGTVAHILTNSLDASGFRTGLYTSPHLVNLEERFRFAGEQVSPLQLVELVSCMRRAELQLKRDGHGSLTFFELTTAIGLLYFAQQNAQCVVLEVGMGGRLDSTNVCSPTVSIITSIGLDHQRQLGETIAEIAREKAGIIKPNTPVICSARHPDARREIAAVAEQKSAPLYSIGEHFEVEWTQVDRDQTTTATGGQSSEATNGSHPAASIRFLGTQDDSSGLFVWSQWTTRLLGRHQADNIAAAVATLNVLAAKGWQFEWDQVRTAVANSQPCGRLQVLSNSPTVILDTAHNPDSVRAGFDALAEHFPKAPITTVFASSQDKNYREMLWQVLSRSERVILTTYHNNPRAAPIAELLESAQRILADQREADHCQVESAESPSMAYQRVQGTFGQQGLLYFTGSFFLASEVLDIPQLQAAAGMHVDRGFHDEKSC